MRLCTPRVIATDAALSIINMQDGVRMFDNVRCMPIFLFGLAKPKDGINAAAEAAVAI